MKKFLPVLAGIVVAGLVVGALAGVGRLPVVSQDTGGGSGEMRWLNVIVDLPPQDSPLQVRGLFPPGPEKPRFVIQIYVERELTPGVQPAPQEVDIDAETGEVVSDTLSAAVSGQAVSSQLQAVLDSVRVATGPPEVWPYADEPPPTGRPSKSGNLTFVLPDPASGILVAPMHVMCPASASDCASQYLTVFNGRSQMNIRADTGQIERPDRVLPEDREAFERYAASVEVHAGTEGGTP